MELTSQNLTKQIKKSKIPVLVEFWGSWCPPCQMMAPILEKLAKKYKHKIKILKINTDKNFSIASEFRIRGLPTFILFKNGKEIKREVGAKSKSELCKIVEISY